MADRRRAPFPEAPDLPLSLGHPHEELRSRDVWQEVEVDEKIAVGDYVADAQIRESIWTGAQLIGRRFTGLVCHDVRFVRCNFAGASLQDAEMTRVTFESCRMSGAIFAGAKLQDVLMTDCVGDLADFRMAQVRRSAAEGCNLRQADFYGSALTDVRLTDCDLAGANFDTATPNGVDLRGSALDGIRGAICLASARISVDQVLPLGAALVGGLGFRIDDV